MLNYLLSVTPVGVGEYMLASWLGMMVSFRLLPFYILCHRCWWLLWASRLDYPKWLGRKKKALLLYDGTRLLAHTIAGSLKLCFVTIYFIVCIIATICFFA